MIPTLALVGAPNSGKTSLFNWLTGSKFKTVNYPGATVESHVGFGLPIYGTPFRAVDTPGLYSLIAEARDEHVTVEVLSQADVSKIILVMDATQLERHLLLAVQLKELKVPFVVALTMSDMSGAQKVDVAQLQKLLGRPVVLIDGRLGGGVKDLVQKIFADFESEPENYDFKLDLMKQDVVQQTELARSIGKKVYAAPPKSLESKLDAWFLYSHFSLLFFVLTMAVLFTCVFFLAAPFMDMVDALFSWTSGLALSLIGENLFGRFVSTGVIEGTGAVLVFVPQIFILFLLLGFLEESGYLARASTLIDRPLQAVGLSGRSFVPILSGFACAVPAVMATRNLRSPRERWIAVFILPFMTCSARLPVYALLLAFLFFGEPAWKPGVTLAAIYFASLLVGGIAALILHKILKSNSNAHFMMELPPYRWPRPWLILRAAVRKTFSYVRKAGPTIFVFVLILWSLTHLPYDSSLNQSEQLASSYMGQVGHHIEPFFKPMGLDWRAGVSLGAAFVAREVFVSSMAVIFNLTDVDENSMQDRLLGQMQQATFADGTPIFTFASVTAMIVFFMLALQCLSTTGVTIREMGSWKFGLIQLVTLNVAAYVLAVATFQILS